MNFKTFFRENHDLAVFLLGILLVAGSYSIYHLIFPTQFSNSAEEVHVHADFLMYIAGEKIDLSDDRYQSSIKQILHEDFHFHDNDQNVIHRHADKLTLVEFLNSLDFKLTKDCLITDNKNTYCTDTKNVLRLYVNDEIVSDILTYIPEEEDRILIYYGNPKDEAINDYLVEISDESCIYSGTCPERGTPPPESCGITCEI